MAKDTSSPESTKIPSEFKKILTDFKKLSEEHEHEWMQSLSPQLSRRSAKKIEDWCALSEKLPVPWPDVVLQKMIHFAPQGGKSSEILRWVQKVHHDKDKKEAKRALSLVFKAGIKPSQFIPQSGVSIVGLAAYLGCLDVVKLCYGNENKEALRLKLLAEHLRSSDKHMVGSTLLHRLVERSGSGEKYVDMVKLILKLDPQACMQQTQNGVFPHQLMDNEESKVCLAVKSNIEQAMLKDETKQAYESKSSASSLPKKM